MGWQGHSGTTDADGGVMALSSAEGEAPSSVATAPWARARRARAVAHRDLNIPRGVLGGVLLASARPSSWTDAAASSRPVLAHPGVSRPVP
jgi:hypothetical protein